MMLGIFFIILPWIAVSSLEHPCTHLYNRTTDEQPTGQVRVQSPDGFRGLVTITAKYVASDAEAYEILFSENQKTSKFKHGCLPDHLEEHPSDHLRFYTPDGIKQPLVIQIYTSGGIKFFMESAEKCGGYAFENQDRFFAEDAIIQIQIWVGQDRYWVQDHHWVQSIGRNENILNFNYSGSDSPTMWREFSEHRLSNATELRADNQFISLVSVTLCEDALPRLVDDTPVYFGFAKEGQPVSMNCTGVGAPTLQPVWSPKHSVGTDFNQESGADGMKLTATATISQFSGKDHSGKWSCHFRNENYKTLSASSRSFFLASVATEPSGYLADGNIYRWSVRAWQGANFTVNCTNSVTASVLNITGGDRQKIISVRLTVPSSSNTTKCRLTIVDCVENEMCKSTKVGLRRSCSVNQYWNGRGCILADDVMSIGIVIGIVIGAVILLVSIAGVGVLCYKKKKKYGGDMRHSYSGFQNQE